MNTNSKRNKTNSYSTFKNSGGNFNNSKDLLRDGTDVDDFEAQVQTKKRKILFLGAPGVGKSAVILRFKDDVFRNDYFPTIQETYRKEFKFNNEKIELEITDMDGQNEYTIINGKNFTSGIHAFVLVYSVENEYSFKLIKSINSRLTSLVGDQFPKLLIANKSDLNEKRIISLEQGKDLAREINGSFLECSARSGSNIQLLFNTALVEINKFESNIDLATLACSSFIRFVMRNQQRMNIFTYFLLAIQLVSKS